MRPYDSSKMWAGPMVLAVIVCLIYLLSLMPTTPPHLPNMINDGHTEYAMKGQVHVEWDEIHFRQTVDNEGNPDDCLNGGITNETDRSCMCTRWYTGEKCEIPVCMNNGYYNATLGRCVCSYDWVGDHCVFRCSSGVVNKTTGACECVFGRPCTLQKCINGHFFDGKCVCYDGFTGPACTTCDGSVNSLQCDELMRRRAQASSRVSLSGMVFCVLTLVLLYVTLKRKRAHMEQMREETWYRMFQPTQDNRCRRDHQICGGSWIPRNRALIIGEDRVTMSSAMPRIHRLATPPPSYTSVDDLSAERQQSQQAVPQTISQPMQPPSYEEATRIDMEPAVEGGELDDPVGSVPTDDAPSESDKREEAEAAEINGNEEN